MTTANQTTALFRRFGHVVALVLLLAAFVAAGVGRVTTYECELEDGSGAGDTVCTWHADRHGNGQGQDVTYIGPLVITGR